jgi:hypothetical protein
LEAALRACDWARVAAAIADSRRHMHALDNAFEGAANARDERFDAHVMTRLRAIEKTREDQMARLAFYNGSVRDRLKLLGRARGATRGFGSVNRRRSSLGALDRLS